MNPAIQVSVLVFAKYFRTRRTTCLKKSKYPEKKENQIPFKYYRTAIAAIIRYHKNNNDPSVFDEAIAKLHEKIDKAEKPSKSAIPLNNLRAVENYRTHFGNRQFKPEAIPSLVFQHGSVVVSAKPEMVVCENGNRKLIRLDMKKSKPARVEVDAVVDVTYMAASQAGVEIEPENVVLLRVEDGTSYAGSKISSARKAQLKDACSEIGERWGEV